MSGHNGWGATSGGSIPRARFTIDLPGGDLVMEFALVASEIIKASKELNCSPRVAIELLREHSILDCTDEQRDHMLAMLGHG